MRCIRISQMLTRDDVVNVNYVAHSEFNLLPNLASLVSPALPTHRHQRFTPRLLVRCPLEVAR